MKKEVVDSLLDLLSLNQNLLEKPDDYFNPQIFFDMLLFSSDHNFHITAFDNRRASKTNTIHRLRMIDFGGMNVFEVVSEFFDSALAYPTTLISRGREVSRILPIYLLEQPNINSITTVPIFLDADRDTDTFEIPLIVNVNALFTY